MSGRAVAATSLLALVLGTDPVGLLTAADARAAAPPPAAAPIAGPEPLPTAEPAPSTPALPSLDATPIPTPTPTPTPIPIPTSSVADLVDRSWPKHPPWDACPQPVWPGELSVGSPGGGRRVLILGDSLTRESRTATAKAMRASGWTPTFRCWGSKRLDWGLSQLARARQLRQVPEFVVVALGTNDISWEPTARTERRVRLLLDRLGPTRKVMWVDLDVDHSRFSHQRAQWFNGMIRREADGRPNVAVVPWRQIARKAKARRHDGIHYYAAGFRLRARTVASALDRFGARYPASPATAQPAPSAPATP